jgi:hypothetical protein
MTQWGLDTLFNPAKRHMDEEKRRLQSTREEVGDSSGGKRIDLESGKVTIRRAEGDADEAGHADSAHTDDHDGDHGSDHDSDQDRADTTESASRRRARLRRRAQSAARAARDTDRPAPAADAVTSGEPTEPLEPAESADVAPPPAATSTQTPPAN